jgi:hypothetical protein
LQALPVPTWLDDLDLLAATWMGQVTRFDRNMAVRWQVKLTPSSEWRGKDHPLLGPLLAKDSTPTVRKADWGNASAKTLPLAPNLIAQSKAIIAAVHAPRAHSDPVPWQNNLDILSDGKPDAPPRPWLTWTDIGGIDSGWVDKLTLEVDTFRTQLRLTAITLVEDATHPESWLRDMRLEWWDPAQEVWQPGPNLLSNAAIHTHVLPKPIAAAKFRFVGSSGGSWPVGNIRLAELVFHGKVLGSSHPDVAAKRPVAVLFDENESDLRCLHYPGVPFAFRYTDAFSGSKCLELKK